MIITATVKVDPRGKRIPHQVQVQRIEKGRTEKYSALLDGADHKSLGEFIRGSLAIFNYAEAKKIDLA